MVGYIEALAVSAGGPAPVSSGGPALTPTHSQHVCSISIKLSSKPQDGVVVPAAAAAAPLGRSDSTAAKRAGLAGGGRAASIKAGAAAKPSSTSGPDSGQQAAVPPPPQQPLHMVQIKVSDLDGLQQEQTTTGSRVQTSCRCAP